MKTWHYIIIIIIISLLTGFLAGYFSKTVKETVKIEWKYKELPAVKADSIKPIISTRIEYRTNNKIVPYPIFHEIHDTTTDTIYYKAPAFTAVVDTLIDSNAIKLKYWFPENIITDLYFKSKGFYYPETTKTIIVERGFLMDLLTHGLAFAGGAVCMYAYNELQPQETIQAQQIKPIPIMKLEIPIR